MRSLVIMGFSLRGTGAWAIVGAMALLSACSSAKTSPAPAGTANAAALSGTYTLASTSETPGTITEVTFQLGQYSLTRSPCATGPDGCGESGTYAVSADATSIALTNARTGVTANEPISLPDATTGVLADLAPDSLTPLSGGLVTASPSALFKCEGSLLSIAKSLLFIGNNYSGGVCPPASVSADECEMSCVYPLTCVKDPSNSENELCVDQCHDTCGTKTCSPSDYVDPSSQWACGNDYCGGACSATQGTTCAITYPGTLMYGCCSDPTVSHSDGNCSMPSTTTNCHPDCPSGTSCVNGTCYDTCFNKCSSSVQCVSGTCR